MFHATVSRQGAVGNWIRGHGAPNEKQVVTIHRGESLDLVVGQVP